jgi:putative peptide zinc metalloprotease protein
MAEKLFSDSWYRVAALKPRLRGHATISRHEYRGRPSYVVGDPATGRHHRLSPAAYAIVARLDGDTPLSAVYERAAAELGDDVPTQDAVIRLLGLLHAADLLLADVTPDAEEVFRRYRKRAQSRWAQRLANPVALQLTLFDPEPLLVRCLPLVRPLFSIWGALLWLAVVGAAALQVGPHWQELTENLLDRVLATQNLVVLWLTYPALKALHELGHAFAARVWGAEVRAFGIAVLALVPSPYVDASGATAFPQKGRRIVVGAAGMAVEIFVAALALFVWLAVEPGVVRSVAHNVMVIGSVSTVLFNANPLLRFDGYYILSDAIGIPNLGRRANEQLAYLVQRHLFGVREALSPARAPGERFWLTAYGIAAGAYQWVALFAIVLLVGSRFFGIGLVLAAWIALVRIGTPLWRFLRFLRESPLLLRTRRRAVCVSGGALLALVLGLGVLPLPLRTLAVGVVWLPERSHVRAGADGFVRRLLATPDTLVHEGDPLIETEDPLLGARVRVIEAQLDELRARYEASWREKPVEAEVLKEQVRAAYEELKRAREEQRQATVRSPADGLFVLPGESVLDRFVQRGELLGYVTDLSTATARVVVAQSDVALVRDHTRRVDARLSSDLDRVHGAAIARAVPGGTNRLPSAALGTAGGGGFAVDGQDKQGTKLLQNVFEFDVSLPSEAGVVHAGQRVYVRFDHGAEPLALRWSRSLRRLLLSRWSV